MKEKRTIVRVLALVLAVLLCLSVVPWTAFASGPVTWTRVEPAHIQATDLIAITMSKDGTNWVLPNLGEGKNGQPLASYTGTVQGDKLTTDQSGLYGWSITSVEGGYTIQNAAGEYLYLTATNNGMRIGDTAAVWTVAEGYLASADSKAEVRYLGVYNGQDWRCYKNTTGNTAGQTLSFWKLDGGETKPVEPTEATEPEVTEAPEAPAYSTIAQALAGEKDAEFTVKGVVTLVDGSNIYLQDDTGAICVRMSSKPGDISLGDTIIGTGKRADYNGLPQLGSGTYEKASGLTLTARETTIAALTTADICGYIKLSGVEVTEVYDNNGAYANPNITVKDAEGNTIQIYKAVADKDGESWGVQVGDKLDVLAAVSCYKETLQLRNTLASELTKVGGEPEAPAAGIPDGEYVLWVGGDYNKALSSVYPEGSYYNSGVSVTLEEGKLSGYGAAEIWTVTNLENGAITISINGKNLGMAESYSSMSLDAINDTWLLEPASEGRYYVKNVGRDQYIQWRAGDYNYFSCYKLSENDAYAISFTPAEAVEEPEQPAGTVADGDYVIWAPAFGMALSTSYGGYYNNGIAVSLAEGALTGYGNAEIWTVTNQDDGTITISCSGGKLSMDTGFSSLPLNKVNDTWVLEDAGNGLWYVKNVGRDCYIEWYEANKYWSGYYKIAEGSEGLFALQFTPAHKGYEVAERVENIAQWGGGYTDEAAQLPYAQGDKYVSGDKLDGSALLTVTANGETVSPYYKPGDNGYMGGNNLGAKEGDQIQLTFSTAGWADMTLSFRVRSTKTGPGSFQLQYSADGGKTFKNFTTGEYAYAYTQYTSEGSTPVTGQGAITDGVARPSLAPTYYVSFAFDLPAGAENCESLIVRLVPGTDRASGTGAVGGNVRIDSVAVSGSPIVDASIAGFVTVAPNGLDEDVPVGTALTMTAGEGETIHYSFDGGKTWKVYDPANKPLLESLPCDLDVYASAEGKADSVTLLYSYAAGTVANVQFIPTETNLYLAEGETVAIAMTCATQGAAIYYSLDGGETWKLYDAAAPDEALTLTKGFGSLSIQAYALRDGFKDSAIVTREYSERTSARYNIYFGQLHAHTNISDGSGSITDAYEHAAGVKNLDFLAVTDHSNSFDGADQGSLGVDGSQFSAEWAAAQAAADAATTDTFVGLYGYEMTWSNGLGHMNTFNTPGWQSRTQEAYKTFSTALQNYYAALVGVPGSISQFNHPGTTFGDFSDFAHYSEEIDRQITLIEVGNGEGAIGSAGYFPSYEYYTRALDKGWHVAPTNNQDNHKGLWGDANTGRSVVLAGSLSERDIYDAMRSYRVYATEDNDLNIYYTLNGNIMGSILNKSDVGQTLSLSVDISDATDAAIGRVEVIVNGGLSVASQNVEGNAKTVEFAVPSTYSYYYIRITQPDGDIAVTAPVWVGKVEAVGITDFTTDAALAVQNQEMDLTLGLFNNEKTDLLIESVVFTIGDEVIHTAQGLTKVGKMDTASYTFSYTHKGLGKVEIYATVNATLNGVSKVYKEKLDLSFSTPDMVTRVVVDGTHLNDYVTGYYQGNINNLPAIAAQSQVEVAVVEDAITAETLENCDLLIVSAPAKKDKDHYTATLFSDSFIALVADYVKNGGSVIVCGLADYQDKGAPSADYHTAAQLNKLLSALGSTMTIADDEVYDEENNGGQAYRLYPATFNADSPWTSGIREGQVYSQYSGCTVDPGQGTWLVKGFDTTYSIDSDGDGLGGIEKGEAVFLAVEETPYGGHIFAAGGVFVSDFEVKAEMDNYGDLPYANRTIIENILASIQVELPLSTISQARLGQLDDVFRVRGYVTAGTANEHNKFFDAIYVQDDTAGITVFPFSEAGIAVGTPIEIVGYIDEYQGDKEIQIISYKLLDTEPKVYAPQKLSNKDAMDYAANGGKLIAVEGEVVSVRLTTDGKGAAEFTLKGENGDLAKVFIDGYILSGTTGRNELAAFVKVGNTVSAAGLLYMHPEGSSDTSVAVLRVRDCDEVKLVKEAEAPTEPTETQPTEPEETTKPTEKPTEPTTKPTTKPTGGNAATGDSSLVVYGLGLMAATLMAMALLVANRRRWFAGE